MSVPESESANGRRVLQDNDSDTYSEDDDSGDAEDEDETEDSGDESADGWATN